MTKTEEKGEMNSKEEKFKLLLGEEWYESLKDVINSQYWENLSHYIASERKVATVYPEQGSDLLFKAFRTTPISTVRVVILGQDPYHDGSYDGFAFSNSCKEDISPSLRNIFAEIKQTIYPKVVDPYKSDLFNSNLERWATQGVLLINTAHTVRKGVAGSHISVWKPFTKKVIQTILDVDHPVVWMLWGNFAKEVFFESKGPIDITDRPQLVLQAAHPSPFSAYNGFFNSNHFNKANEFLQQYGLNKIIW